MLIHKPLHFKPEQCTGSSVGLGLKPRFALLHQLQTGATTPEKAPGILETVVWLGVEALPDRAERL